MYLFIFLLTPCLAISFAKPKADLKSFSVEALMPLRGILAVFIVLHHCVLRTDGAGADVPWVLNQFSFMGAPVVAVFFFLSGYGLTRSLNCKGEAYLHGFLHKRLSKILLPLIVCSIVYSLVDIAILGGQFSSIRQDWPFLPNCWFCVTIAIYYLAFYILARRSKGKIKTLMMAMFLFTIAYIALLKILQFGSWWFQTPVSLNMGMFAACYEGKMRNILKVSYRLIEVILLFALIGCSYLTRLEDICGWPIEFMLLSVLLGAFVYVMVCRSPLPNNKVLCFLGKYSYEIYLVHGAIISVLFGRAYTYIADWWHVFVLLTLLSSFAAAVILRKVVSYIHLQWMIRKTIN